MAAKNTNRGDHPPAYGEPPQAPRPAYGGYGGYEGYEQGGQSGYYQQGLQGPQGQQAVYQSGPQMGYYNQQQGPFPAQGQYPGQYAGGYNQYPQGQYPQGQYTQGQYPQGYYPGGPARRTDAAGGFLSGLALGTACCCCLDCLLC